MTCKAKEINKVSRRGEPSIEWYKDGKPLMLKARIIYNGNSLF